MGKKSDRSSVVENDYRRQMKHKKTPHIPFHPLAHPSNSFTSNFPSTSPFSFFFLLHLTVNIIVFQYYTHNLYRDEAKRNSKMRKRKRNVKGCTKEGKKNEINLEMWKGK